MQSEESYTLCVCVLMCMFMSLAQLLFVFVANEASVMVAHKEQNAGPILRTWGTWVDVRGLRESKGLRSGPTQTLTYCVCCLRHCVLENKSFGGDTGYDRYLWAATQASAFCYILCLFSSYAHVETTLYSAQYFTCIISLPCHSPVFSLKLFPSQWWPYTWRKVCEGY